MTETLKRCPFCGGQMQFRKALWPSDGDVDSIIHAQSPAPIECGLIDFSISTTDESVIAAWNTRNPSADPGWVLAIDAIKTEIAGMRGRADWFRNYTGTAPWAAALATEIDHWERRLQAALAASPAADPSAPPVPVVIYNNQFDPVGMAEAKRLNEAHRRVMESAAADTPQTRWQCECGCYTYARIDEAVYLPNMGRKIFRPGPNVRCVSCKRESLYPAQTGKAGENWIDKFTDDIT